MYKRILVPLDTSRQAEMILPYVEELARHMQSEVLLLVIVEPGEQRPSTHEAKFYIDAFDRDFKEAKDYLAGLQGSLKQMGLSCRGYVVYGAPLKTIIRAAESEDADLVAMTSHTHSGIASAFSGGLAAGVLQGINKPLLVIRSPGKN